MVTSPIKRKVKPDTLVFIELNAVVDISVDAGFLVVITNLLSAFPKSQIKTKSHQNPPAESA